MCWGGVWLPTACFPSCAAVSLPCFSHCSFVIEMLKSLPANEEQRNRQARSIWFLDALIRFRAQKVIKGKSKAHRHLLILLFPAAESFPQTSVQPALPPAPAACLSPTHIHGFCFVRRNTVFRSNGMSNLRERVRKNSSTEVRASCLKRGQVAFVL